MNTVKVTRNRAGLYSVVVNNKFFYVVEKVGETDLAKENGWMLYPDSSNWVDGVNEETYIAWTKSQLVRFLRGETNTGTLLA